MNQEIENTEELLNLAKQGDRKAFEALFTLHRNRLRKAISFRMNDQLAARVDTSDILQETYLEAAHRLPDYLKDHNMPLYLWLWWIARDKIIAAHRFHRVADKRSVDREVASLPLDSSAQLVKGLLSKGPTPSQELRRAELAEGLKEVFDKLNTKDREIIMLRHFEQLSSQEVSSLLKISKAAANKRYLRALDHLKKLLVNVGISNSSSSHGRDTAFKIAKEINENHDARSLPSKSPCKKMSDLDKEQRI